MKTLLGHLPPRRGSQEQEITTRMGEIEEKYLLGGTFLLEIQNMYLKDH